MADNVNALPALPVGSTANNVPGHLDLLKDAINAGSIIRRLSGAAIAALSGVELTAGTVVYNTTTGKLQVSTGAAFVDVADASKLPLAGGTMSGAIAMGGNRVTGLAKGTATGDAIARQQIQSGNTGPIAHEGYATITFSPAFASTPTVVFSLTGVSNLAAADMWVSDATASSARINNSSGDIISANWIAVGN